MKGQDAADAFNAALGGEGNGAGEVNEEDAVVDEGEDAEVVDVDATCDAVSSSTSAAAAASWTAAMASNATKARDDEEAQGAVADSDD